MGFKIETLNPIPPKSNPFSYDSYNMGTKIGANCTVMYDKFPRENHSYLIVINTATGERVKLEFEPDFYQKLANEIRRDMEICGDEIEEGEEFVFTMNEGSGMGWRRVSEDGLYD